MQRADKLKEESERIISESERPSASRLAEELEWSEEDVHSCLNVLEKKGEIETYVKEFLGRKMRLVSLKR